MKYVLFLFTLTWASVLIAQDSLIIQTGSVWKYLDDGSNQGTFWRNLGFDDAGWAEGPSELGYGDGDEATVVGYGGNANDKHITTYFRHSFNIDNPDQFVNYLIRLKRDDAAIVYVNGTEVMRSNFGTNTYGFNDESYSSTSGEEEDNFYDDFFDADLIIEGENVIAVEVHQSSGSSSDITFDLHLYGFDANAEFYRVPYVQSTTPNSAVIMASLDAPAPITLYYGTSHGDISNQIEVLDVAKNHEIPIEGLQPGTKYYYQLSLYNFDVHIESPEHFFTTHPEEGTDTPTRIWITGDAGTGHSEQIDVRDAYLNYIGSNGKADLWLMMGDNAYEHGRQSDYQMGLFNVYEDILINTVAYPTSGNHDFYGEASPTTQTGPYFDIFALPTNGEAGGVASGTEAYYSFNYGNIHCIALESYELDRDSTGVMATWLKEDLAANNQKWTIVYWHYAPYTKVGHDSDDPNDHSGRAIEMREQIVPILEKYGVDLVLGGHSHGYERSYLLDGHYGFSNTLEDNMILDEGDGRADGDGAYLKPLTTTANSGVVYLVCGSSGKLSSAPSSPHPVMFTTNTAYAGSTIIDISGDTLEGKFLNELGMIQDYFHIVKNEFAGVVDQEQTINLYPNPSNGKVFVDMQDVSGEVEYQVFNVSGQIIVAGQWSMFQENSIDFSHLSKGVYTVRMMLDGKHYSSELLVVE